MKTYFNDFSGVRTSLRLASMFVLCLLSLLVIFELFLLCLTHCYRRLPLRWCRRRRGRCLSELNEESVVKSFFIWFRQNACHRRQRRRHYSCFFPWWTSNSQHRKMTQAKNRLDIHVFSLFRAKMLKRARHSNRLNILASFLLSTTKK